MNIFTSYYANYRKFGDLVPVAISIYPPNGFKGKLFQKIAPTKEMLEAYKRNKNEQEYKERYWHDVIKKYNPKELYEEIKRLVDGKDCVLLCFEKPNDFCHRHLFATWMNKNGYNIQELMR